MTKLLFVLVWFGLRGVWLSVQGEGASISKAVKGHKKEKAAFGRWKGFGTWLGGWCYGEVCSSRRGMEQKLGRRKENEMREVSPMG